MSSCNFFWYLQLSQAKAQVIFTLRYVFCGSSLTPTRTTEIVLLTLQKRITLGSLTRPFSRSRSRALGKGSGYARLLQPLVPLLLVLLLLLVSLVSLLLLVSLVSLLLLIPLLLLPLLHPADQQLRTGS